MNGGISGRTYLPLAYAFFFGWISLLTRRNSDILEIIVMCFLCSVTVKSRIGVQSWNLIYSTLLRKSQITCAFLEGSELRIDALKISSI